MSRTSSNARSLAYATEVLGWEHTEIVERWNPYGGARGVRQDLFGFLDLLALTGGRIVGIQACGGGDAAAHRRKIENEPKAHTWLRSGLALELWAWRKIKAKRGGKLRIWSVLRQVAALDGWGVIEWRKIDEWKAIAA